MIVGYARVSTEGKTVDAQMKQLRDAGAEKILKSPIGDLQTPRL